MTTIKQHLIEEDDIRAEAARVFKPSNSVDVRSVSRSSNF